MIHQIEEKNSHVNSLYKDAWTVVVETSERSVNVGLFDTEEGAEQYRY